MYRAASEGISVAKPYGDSHRYDFLVQHGRRLLRVQVKSAFTRPKNAFGYRVIVARMMPSHKHAICYSRDEIDFVVCFIAPVDAWYIIPVEKLGRRQGVHVFPNGQGQRMAGLYEDYREAWHLLKDDDEGAKATDKQEDNGCRPCGTRS